MANCSLNHETAQTVLSGKPSRTQECSAAWWGNGGVLNSCQRRELARKVVQARWAKAKARKQNPWGIPNFILVPRLRSSNSLPHSFQSTCELAFEDARRLGACLSFGGHSTVISRCQSHTVGCEGFSAPLGEDLPPTGWFVENRVLVPGRGSSFPPDYLLSRKLARRLLARRRPFSSL